MNKPQLNGRNGLWPLPKERLGHTPPPPRPFGLVGGIIAVDANRQLRGYSHLVLGKTNQVMKTRIAESRGNAAGLEISELP